MTVPAGQVMAMATAPAMEWLTLMNSTSNAPMRTVCLGCTTLSWMPEILCSASLPRMRAQVSFVPYTGAGTLLNT